jgi:GxxExxY protein
MIENIIANRTIGCALKIHRSLGPGLLESAYKECLFYELQKEGYSVQKEVPMPLIYEDVYFV